MNLLFEISDRLLIIIGLIVVLLIAIGVLIYKLASRKVKPIDEDERYDSDDIKVTKITETTDSPIELTDEQKEAKAELERVFSRMSADLEKQNAKDEVEEFEREQEENAIISYQELMAQAEKLKEEANRYEKMAESKADMKVKEAMNTYDRHEKHEIKKEKINTKKKTQAFKSSDIVSPIYGIQSNKNMVRQKNSSKKQNRDIIDDAYEENSKLEKTQNLEFLNSLKEFRNNL